MTATIIPFPRATRHPLPMAAPVLARFKIGDRVSVGTLQGEICEVLSIGETPRDGYQHTLYLTRDGMPGCLYATPPYDCRLIALGDAAQAEGA